MHRLRRGNIKIISAEKPCLFSYLRRDYQATRPSPRLGGLRGSHQEGPAHHRRFLIFTPCLSSWEFRTRWTFSLLRTLGHLPLEVLTSDVGILRDRTLIRPSLSPRKVSSLAILAVALRPGSAVVHQDKEFKFGVTRSSVSAA